METSLLKWIKEDIENNFKIQADYWEIDPVILRLDLKNEKIDISINLYASEQAFIDGASPLKVRKYRVDLSGWTGIKEMLIGKIKEGIESMTETRIINDETGETETVPGFFAPEV